MAKQWKPGDRVKLASGGPEMTVDRTERRGGGGYAEREVVICQWFDGTQRQEAEFGPDTLVEVK